jgi:primosomal protein N' (replication factor Y)
VPEEFRGKISAGARVLAPFGSQRKIGYVVKLAAKSGIRQLKSILKLVDEIPILDKNMLQLAKELSEYYCCSWGEAIETALPMALRKGKAVELESRPCGVEPGDLSNITLAHSLDVFGRWDKAYFGPVRDTLDKKKSVIILLPDKPAVLKAEKIIAANFACSIAVLSRNHPDELQAWLKIKQGKADIVIGTRSAIFAPLNNLGLIIIDDEQAYGYKQDQMPHYHAREAAVMRAHIEKAKLILGSAMPSLESFYLSEKGSIAYQFIPRPKAFPEIKICDMKGLPIISSKKNIILSKYLADSIFEAIGQPVTAEPGAGREKVKVLLFLDRLGFATTAFCFGCGKILKCQRCNINLVFHYDENILRCHYCGFKMPPPNLCPTCNAGYIRYTGAGTEKIESELARLFPQAQVKRLGSQDNINIDEADIFISTQSIIRGASLNFGLIGVLGIDNSLNHVDFRAGEKAFDVLCGLAGLTDKKMVIQTSLPQHFVFLALLNKNHELFYKEELKQRKELDFPPYRHFALIKLRGSKEDKVASVSSALFNKFNTQQDKTIEFVSVNPSYPSKLRGNFCWQILARSKSAQKLSGFLKKNLKNFSHSGIIITVDMDPV